MSLQLGVSTRSRRYPQLKDGWSFIESDFSGGLNTTGAAYEIAENQARDCLNVHTNPLGSIRKRNGFTTLVNLSTGSPTKILSLAPANLSTKYLLSVDDAGRLNRITTGGTVSNLATGLNTSARWEWTQALSGSTTYMFGVNGTDTPRIYDTSGGLASWTATTGTTPNGKYLAYQGARIWMAGDSSAPSRLYFSGITGTAPDPFNWDANDYVDLEPGDGQAITALGIVGPYVLAFKPRKTFVITDVATGANRKLSEETGCVAHRSLAETPSGTMFLSEDGGIFITNGSTVQRVSDNITPTLQAAAGSPTTYALAAGAYADYRYYLSLSTGLSVNDHIYEYDLQTSSWWRHDCASNQFALSDPTGTPKLFSGNPSNPRIEQAFVSGTFQDNGANYVGKSYYTRPYLTYTQPHASKRLREVRVDGSGSWQPYIAFDFFDTFSPMEGIEWSTTDTTAGIYGSGTGSYGSGAGVYAPISSSVSDWRYPTPGYGRAFSYKFVNDDSGDFELFSMTSAVIPRTD